MTSTQPLRTPAVSAGRDYKTLPAWQKAMALTLRIFSLTENFPIREQAGLAASSRAFARRIATDIALASAEENDHGMAARYAEAQAAAAALSTELQLALELGYVKPDELSSLQEDADHVLRLIIAMKHGLKVHARDEARTKREGEREERAHEKRNRDYKKSDDREERPRREFKPRDGDERPRREYKPRDDRGGDERPRREYKPRDDRGDDKPFRKPRDAGSRDDRPRREFKPRDGDDRPRREYKPRDDRGGDRKPYGKSGGGKKPFKR